MEPAEQTKHELSVSLWPRVSKVDGSNLGATEQEFSTEINKLFCLFIHGKYVKAKDLVFLRIFSPLP